MNCEITYMMKLINLFTAVLMTVVLGVVIFGSIAEVSASPILMSNCPVGCSSGQEGTGDCPPNCVGYVAVKFPGFKRRLISAKVYENKHVQLCPKNSFGDGKRRPAVPAQLHNDFLGDNESFVMNSCVCHPSHRYEHVNGVGRCVPKPE